ncbi:hypothetical protein, partial [uncultured Xanthomonas sp.]|uniref:hypothetical protein n=1 Tax=uncultured Xanthomonas sp. TaxID=152831 RepID=UPI0025E8D579
MIKLDPRVSGLSPSKSPRATTGCSGQLRGVFSVAPSKLGRLVHGSKKCAAYFGGKWEVCLSERRISCAAISHHDANANANANN